MRSRELKPTEWAAYFDGFSRQMAGHPVTVAVRGAEAGHYILAKQLPLLGITSEPASKLGARSIAITAGDVTHVVPLPYRVRVGQISNGSDEVLIIKSADGPTTIVDFSPGGVVNRLAPMATNLNLLS
jgi:hypothetical protein